MRARLLVGILFLAGSASAQKADEAERAFQQGLSLYDAGRYAEACPKFGESFALDPKLGTLQNLAACHEKEGKQALALSEWSDLASRAQKQNKPDREKLAREHVVSLTSTLPKLKLIGALPDRVELDDVELAKESLTGTLPIDKGHHRLVFSAPGKQPVQRSFDVGAQVVFELEVPQLESIEAPPVAEKRSLVPWIVGGAGVAALGVGTFFGLSALGSRSDSDAECPGNRCTVRGVELNDRAQTEAWVANIAIGAGLIAIAAGVYLLVTGK